jgi:SAM-dependent methyltransferase
MAPVDSTAGRMRRSSARILALVGDVASEASRRLAARDGGSLFGDRWIEWSFCLARLAAGAGRTLDFGADVGFLSLAAAQRGHEVVALDRMPPALAYSHDRVTPVQADILDRPLGDQRFDQILNCSSVEHVGLAGRYGSSDQADGDLLAMEILSGLLEPEGRMLLSIPVGLDLVCPPMHRIYGAERLPVLLEGYDIDEEQYWHRRPQGWEQTDKATALATEGSRSFYSLGLFVLRRRS